MRNLVKFLLLFPSAFLISMSMVFSQDELEIKGFVLNSKNEPIEGVSVSIEGQSKTPEITNSSGYFRISSKIGTIWVSFTPYEKYKAKRVFFNYPEEVVVYLTDQDIMSGSDPVLNIGPEKERVNLVSSLNTLDNRVFDFHPLQSADQFMQGKLPGVLVVNQSGMPGAGSTILLGGLPTSFHGNNMPRIIVDGMPLENGNIYNYLITGGMYNPLSAITPQDISGISVIRGASASLYGVKGSNGIILIETLKPKDINTTMEFSFKTGVNFEGKQLPQLNSRQHKTLVNEIIMTSGIPEETFTQRYPGLYLNEGDPGFIKYSHDFNWQNEVFSNSNFRDAYFNIMGGDAIGRYGLSVGYLDHEGIMGNTGFTRFTSRFVGTFNMFEWLRVSVSANLVTSNANLKESSLTRESSPVFSSLSKSPMLNPYQYDMNNNRLAALQNVDELGVSNPTAIIDIFDARNMNTRFLTSFRLEGDLTESLKLNALIGLNINALRQSVFYPNQGMELYYNDEVWNTSKSLTSNLFSMYNDNYLSYHKDFKNAHDLEIIGGVKWQTSAFEEDIAIAKNLNPNDQFQFLQAGSAILRETGGDVRNWNWMSGYARVNYSFLNRYLFELNTSADLSSNVGREAPGVILINNLPYGTFYSGAFSWRMSNESFMRNIKAIEDLRLNFQYGITGNDDIGTRSRHEYYSLMLYRETAGMVPAGYSNATLQYEQVNEYSISIDLSLRGDRFRLSAESFNRKMSDMLIYEKLSSYLGDDEYPSNNASVINTGITINAFGRIIKTRNFNFDLDFNLARVGSEVLNIKGEEIITQMPGYEIINRKGSPVNSFYGYIFDGVFSSVTEAEEANLKNRLGIPFLAGDAIFRDISGPGDEPDGIIDDHDKVILGASQPELFGGVSTTFSFKGWMLNIAWQFSYGNEVFNYVRFQNEKMSDLSNQSISTLRRWSYEEQKTDIPRVKWNDPVGNSSFSTRWVEDGSYLRCKEITLAYKVPKPLLFLRDLTVFSSAINVFTFTRYLGYDPEFGYSYHPFTQGVDFGLMPQSRKVVFGIKFGL